LHGDAVQGGDLLALRLVMPGYVIDV